LPHLWPTGSSSGSPPSITARYFSSCPSDSTSRWTPCPPGVTQEDGSRSALAVSDFRLRARLGFPYLPSLPGQRGITPAFGYGAPHPSARGTSTLLNNALLSAHYGQLRLPCRPCRISFPYIHQLPLLQHRQGSPVFILVWLPLRVTPVTPEAHLSVLVVIRIAAPVFPSVGEGRQLHCDFRGYIWVRSRCDPQVCSTP
jgi:hypothetical protein